MLGKRNCRVGSCGGAAITTLDHQVLCLNHFLLRCYEKLEGLDPRGILLWAGELFLLLRAPRLTLAQSIASSEGHLAARAASPNF